MKKFLVVFAMICLIAVPQISSAYSVSLTDFEGRPAEANLEIIGAGTNQITFELSLVDTIADFRGFFFNLSGELSNFHIEGNDITKWDASGNVTSLGHGVNMTGTGKSFDVGIEIGTQGIGKDDIQSTTFTVYNDSELELKDLFGVRLTSVGADREGSRKLLSTSEPPDGGAAVPEPGTIALMGIGLLSLAGFRKKFRKR
jgi:hypothetical protein